MKKIVWLLSLLVFTVGWTWPSSLGGTWQGPAMSTVCGKKSEQPLEVRGWGMPENFAGDRTREVKSGQTFAAYGGAPC
jgi:hypothetical protein